MRSQTLIQWSIAQRFVGGKKPKMQVDSMRGEGYKEYGVPVREWSTSLENILDRRLGKREQLSASVYSLHLYLLVPVPTTRLNVPF